MVLSLDDTLELTREALKNTVIWIQPSKTLTYIVWGQPHFGRSKNSSGDSNMQPVVGTSSIDHLNDSSMS